MDHQGLVCAVGPGLGVACWAADRGATRPTPLTSESELVDVCVLDDGGCVLGEDGHVECWDVDGIPPPERVFAQISCGESHACGVTQDGDVECWGPCYHDLCDTPP